MIKFNLRDKKARGKTMILLLFSYGKFRLRMSTGISCHVKDWNFKKQRLYERFDITYSRKYNHHLNRLEIGIIAMLEEIETRRLKISLDEFKELIRKRYFTSEREVKFDFFWTHFDTFVQYKRNKIKQIGEYDLALRKHLKNTEETIGRKLLFEDFNRSSPVLIQFDHYLRNIAPNIQGEKGLSINTIGKQYKNLKVFINWCFEENLIAVFSLKHFVVERVDIDSIYLKEHELSRLEGLELTGKLELCRDLFLLGCETGLRFSDFCGINSGQIKDNLLEVKPQKTRNSSGKKILIPLSGRAQKILLKYKNQPPHWPAKRLNDFNDAIRKCGEIAQIVELQNVEKRTGGQLREFTFKKWELMSSHNL